MDRSKSKDVPKKWTKQVKKEKGYTSVTKVSETDTSGTAATSGNQITLYTCVMNERDYRWCVVAQEV